MACQIHEYTCLSDGPPPAYEDEQADSPPTYSSALFDKLGERISRIREQVDITPEDMELQTPEDLEISTTYTTAFVRYCRENRGARLERPRNEPSARTWIARQEALPPEFWSLGESLHQARLRPNPRQPTGTTSRDTSPAPPRSGMEIWPREALSVPLETQTRPISQVMTRPSLRPRKKHHHHGQASDLDGSIHLIWDGVSWLSNKVVKISRLVRSKYQRRRQQEIENTEV